MTICIVVNIRSEAFVGFFITIVYRDKLEQGHEYMQALSIKLDICYEFGQEASIAPLKQVKYHNIFEFLSEA